MEDKEREIVSSSHPQVPSLSIPDADYYKPKSSRLSSRLPNLSITGLDPALDDTEVTSDITPTAPDTSSTTNEPSSNDSNRPPPPTYGSVMNELQLRRQLAPAHESSNSPQAKALPTKTGWVKLIVHCITLPTWEKYVVVLRTLLSWLYYINYICLFITLLYCILLTKSYRSRISIPPNVGLMLQSQSSPTRKSSTSSSSSTPSRTSRSHSSAVTPAPTLARRTDLPPNAVEFIFIVTDQTGRTAERSVVFYNSSSITVSDLRKQLGVEDRGVGVLALDPKLGVYVNIEKDRDLGLLRNGSKVQIAGMNS